MKLFSRGILVSAVVLAWGCGKRTEGSNADASTGTDSSDTLVDLGVDAELCTGGTLCGSPAACCPAGNECYLDTCVPACTSGVYCGVGGTTCCDGGQVCISETCATPGRACADSYDCDPGEFCEPTLGQCLPQPDPLTCQLTPTFTTLEPTLEWSYTAHPIISIPVIANLDGVGAPEVVVNTTHDGGSFPNGRIAILDGATGAVLVQPIPHNPPTSYGSHGRSTIAIGDVSGDGLPDIIYLARADAQFRSLIVAIDRTGAVLWTSHLPAGTAYGFRGENGAITLANFDGDAQSEIVFGASLIDHDGTVVWDQGGNGTGGTFGTNNGYSGGISAVADLDGDVAPEIVSGKNAWKVAWNATTPASTVVTPYWTYAGDDGYPAIADLDSNGTPEVILAANTRVHVLNGQTGALWCAIGTCTTPELVQPFAIPTGTTSNRGGPPTIADFDADGRPEIGIAGGRSYSVYDLYRTGELDLVGTPALGQTFVRWSRMTQDLSSNATGSSLFDFQGDGSSEVIYQDECNVWVYGGRDGATQLQLPNTTGTIHEYPLVVDADGDGNSEIVIVANDEGAGANCPGQAPRKGIFVYGDTNDRWVPTRKVWTQHAYHVTNATSAGNVPLVEDNNWTTPGLNDYRKNAQGEGVFNAPNLIVELSVALDRCDLGMLTLRARVTNAGALGVYPGAVVEFRLNDATGTVLGTGAVPVALLPGGSAIVKLDVASGVGANFWAGVDGAPAVGAVSECDETDNQDATSDARCPVIF